MANIDITKMEEDIRDLKDWTAQHDAEHTADTKLLASIVESVSTHQDNHHSRTSVMKQGGAVGLGVTLLYVAVELVQRFLL